MDKLVPLDLPPGMRNTGTVYQSKGRWYTGNFVRFFNDTIQPIGGWTARTLTGATMGGVPRAMVTYRLNDNVQIMVVGTTHGLYALTPNALSRSSAGFLAAYAATPVTGVSEAFDTADWTASTGVTLDLNSGRLRSQSTTVSGVVRNTTIANRADRMVQAQIRTTAPGGFGGFNGVNARIEETAAPNDYVQAIQSAGSLTNQRLGEVVAGVLTTDSTGTATQSLDTDYRIGLSVVGTGAASRHFTEVTTRTITLAAGSTSGRAGFHHGSGDASVDIEVTDWYDMTGRYITVNGPATAWTADILDSNGDVLATAAASAGVATVDMLAVAFPAAVTLEITLGGAVVRSVTPTGRLWGGDVWTWSDNVAVYDITPTAVVPRRGANRVWQLDVFGAYLVAIDLLAPSIGGQAYYWDGDTSAIAVPLAPFTGTVPVAPLSVVTTPERFLVMLGALYTASGWDANGIVPASRVVTWATQEGGFTGSEWVPSATNTAGDFTLTTEGALVCGRRSRNGTLLWTTTDLWVMTYIGGDFVYRFDQAGNSCGIISSRAVVVNDAGAFWMGDNGFFEYDGFVRPIPCDVQDYVFGSLNRDFDHYIWAVENPSFGEITWFYPHAAQTEVTRYVTYNYREKHWVTGTLSRTAGVSQQPGTTVFPVMMNATRTVFDHETGSARNSEGTPSLESGPIELADGDRVLALKRVIPDDDTVGDVTMTIYTAAQPDSSETANGPYTLSAHTSIRLKARQIRVKLTEAVATAWRVGKIRLGVREAERRG